MKRYFVFKYVVIVKLLYFSYFRLHFTRLMSASVLKQTEFLLNSFFCELDVITVYLGEIVANR